MSDRFARPFNFQYVFWYRGPPNPQFSFWVGFRREKSLSRQVFCVSILSCRNDAMTTDCQLRTRETRKRELKTVKHNLFTSEDRLKIPNPSPWLPISLSRCFLFPSHPFPCPSLSLSLTFSLPLCLLLYLHISPAHCSGSESGNRSVTCHYWSNSVIRHRRLTVCSALYAGTAGVLCTEVEIRFDTPRVGADGGRGTERVCTFVSVSKEETWKDGEIDSRCFCVSCVGEWIWVLLQWQPNPVSSMALKQKRRHYYKIMRLGKDFHCIINALSSWFRMHPLQIWF